MSFYRVLKPTKEAMEKIEKYHVSTYDDIKENLMAICMEKTDMIKARKEIAFALNYIYMCIQAEVHEDAHKQFEENGTIEYCGAEFRSNYPHIDEKTLKEHTNHELSILKAIVPTPDYFEEKTKFYEKINDITEIIDDYIMSAYTVAQYEIVNVLSEFDVTYKEDEEETENE